MKKKYVTKKYNGDDCYSWAVFRTEDVKGMGSIIMLGEARPVICGLSRATAQSEARSLNDKD